MSMLLVNCSPSDNSEPDETGSENPNPISNARYISKMRGHDDAEFYYENDLLTKGVGNSGSNIDKYYAAFQIEYKTNGRVDRLLVSHSAWMDKPADFSFDLKNEDDLEEYIYNYENGQLESITRENGEIDQEFFYDDQGNVVKNVWYYYEPTYENEISTREYEFQYDNGKLKSYIFYNSRSGETEYGDIEFDDKINPFYIFWQESSFVMPWDFAYIMDSNFSFYPHNILKIYEASEKNFGVSIEYEGDYPIIYDVDDTSNYERKPTNFIYLD